MAHAFDADISHNPVYFLCCFFGASLCAGGGIGGGAFYIAVYILLMGLDPHLAIPLSKATVFGAALGGYIVNYSRRHPQANRPMIDYGVALLMEPMTLLGTRLGVFLNVTMPAYVIIVSLIALLSITAYRTIRTGLKTYRREQEPYLPLPEEVVIDDEDQMVAMRVVETDEHESMVVFPLRAVTRRHSNQAFMNEDTPGDDSDDDDEFEGIDVSEVDDGVVARGAMSPREKRLAEIYEGEATIPRRRVALLIFVWVITMGLIFATARLKCGTLWFWALQLGAAMLLIVLTIATSKKIVAETEEKQILEYRFVDGDVRFDIHKAFAMSSLAIIAGMAAGFLGIGGGLVKGPIMLEFGMVAGVAAATSSFMMLFTSSSTTLQYLLFGRLQWVSALYYFAAGLFGALLGQTVVSHVVKKHKKQYIITFLLAFVTVLSMVLLTWVALRQIWDGSANMDFLSLCKALKLH
eukprot:TRINITY_DN4483_c0_g1_i1.p1 TRINITY_DN4483_c0_g1~~TRINITY_DN4483_c0_g1_i1.p1  ORF type:complete len:465 (+),score=98.73 TRINITY_DN4483_c0_g1_i1:207-1601(+)